MLVPSMPLLPLNKKATHHLKAAGDAGRCRRRQVPTGFAISADEVCDLIEAGGNMLRASPEVKTLMDSLSPPVNTPSPHS